MSETLVLFGVVLFFVAVILIVMGLAEKGDVKFGFGGFIGPIPFGFANDPKMLWLVLAVSVVLIILFIFPFIKQFV